MKTGNQIHAQIHDDETSTLIDVVGDYIAEDPGDSVTPPIPEDVVNIEAEDAWGKKLDLDSEQYDRARLALLYEAGHRYS